MKGLYNIFRQALGRGQINLETADIRLLPVRKSLYTANLATHTNISDIPTTARGPASGNLPSKQVTAAGWFTAGTAVSTNTEYNDPVDALVLYVHTTGLLIYYDDEAQGLPATPSGDNMEWSFSGTGIFRV